MDERRIGVIGIVIDDAHESAGKINKYLSEFSNIIVGRMGIPYRERNICIISVVVDGTTDEISALTGKLGSIKGVNVKTAFSNKKFVEG
ncbi:MAG: iron-only hydrogenase system regulator [Clostridiales bacterium]|nr:iron-only hydrogenase system regulator [Clostridiales bacterium]HBM79544.1 CopG family transcriptional regulator [Clostridiaceae bacterium]